MLYGIMVLENCILNSLRKIKLGKRLRNKSPTLDFRILDNSSSNSIIDVLEMICLLCQKTIIQRIAVVKPGVKH